MSDETESKRLLPPAKAREIDHQLRGQVAVATRGVSPVDVAAAVVDWAGHLVLSPGKLLSLAESMARNGVELAKITGKAVKKDTEDLPAIMDRRMLSEDWQRWPFNVFAQGHRMAKGLAAEATTGVDGVSKDHEQLVSFLANQIVEMASPANIPVTNPEFITTTREERGANLKRGVHNLAEDMRRKRSGELPQGLEDFAVGRDIGITPGKVVFQNRLFELIQYKPQTEEVVAEPVLVVPAWIMKYYILDLSPRNSLVRYLVSQGKTVFIMSWKNPDEGDRDLGMHEYLHDGVMAAFDAVSAIVPKRKIHAVGYCLGGTLLSIAAAYMARERDDRVKTMTMFAAQIDFREAGEITTMLGEGTFTFLEALMRRQGYLTMENMTGAFAALRVSDLVYDPMMQRYLLGKDRSLNDLMAWNEDGTRMPYKMHTEYLRNCYMENNLAEARYEVNGKPVCVGDIRVPAFVLGTATDHVAPWQSVYKAMRLMNNEMTFALTTGGHNAGIACGPEHPRRKHWIATHKPGDLYVGPEEWQAQNELTDGSWWPVWNAWLDARSSKERVKPPSMGKAKAGYKALRDAPGVYVFG
jgi:polyhydroxyalkanoate synthase